MRWNRRRILCLITPELFFVCFTHKNRVNRLRLSPSIQAAAILLLFLWELPQNLLGLLVWLALRKRILSRETEDGRILLRVSDFGLSLGTFIFWSMADPAVVSKPAGRTNNRVHELGHAVQSRRLGPLYLLAVGLPSVCRFLYARFYRRRQGKAWTGYFNGYPENWADRLAEKSSRNGGIPQNPNEDKANA
jgi:hypothetical protein